MPSKLAQASAAGSSKCDWSKMKPNEIANYLITKYHKGFTQLPIERMAVGSFNRNISPKYVHHRAKTIEDVDGFSQHRYKYAIVLEPNPADPLAGARRTNNEALMANGLLPYVAVESKHELATKNHLYLWLLCVQSGRIPKDHNKEVCWTRPTTDGDLSAALSIGLHVQILSKDVWVESLDHIKTIMLMDNQDQTGCLADDEMGIAVQIKDAMAVSSAASPGKALFEVVWEKIKATVQPFSKKDCSNIYDLIRTLPVDPCLLLLKLFHFLYINPSCLRFTPKSLKFISIIGDDCPMVKICFACSTYMKQDWDTIAGVCYVTVEEKYCIYLQQQTSFLIETENFLKHHLQGIKTDDTEHAVLKFV